MQKHLLAAVAAASLLVHVSASAEHRGSDPSLASAQSSATVSAGVVVLPLSLIVGGSVVVDNSLKSLHTTLSEQSRWTVQGMTAQGDRTVVALQSEDRKATLTVSVPTTQVERAHLGMNQAVTAERLGQHSFALKTAGMTLGVLSAPGANLSHSSVKH